MVRKTIALELLEVEHERLLLNHYDYLPLDGPAATDPADFDCDDCGRAFAVRLEIEYAERMQQP
jgi:hypothetical protein